MPFESLHRLGSTADRLFLYPSYMMEAIEDLGVKGADDAGSDDGTILRRVRHFYGVKLKGVEVISQEGMA